MPGLASCQGIPHVALEHHSRARQAEGHADIAVGWSLASADARRLDELLRPDPVEPGDVDADTELLTLARAVSHAARQATIALQNPCALYLLDCLADELLTTWCLRPAAFFWEACFEERLHLVQDRLPRDPGQV